MKDLRHIIWLSLTILIFPTHTEAKSSALEKIESLLNGKVKNIPKIKTINDLLPLLPKELRQNFTFIYHSRSPHGGLGEENKSSVDKEFPRVVLFTPDARLLLAFTGNPNKPGYDELEYIHFNNQTASFELGRYILPAAIVRDPNKAEEAKLNGETNPAACLRCHGLDPRPFTDSYPLWPGFYGSIHDTFPPESPELQWYKAFLKKQRNDPKLVYSKLLFPKGSPTSPYINPAKFNPDQIEAQDADFPFMPNSRLGMALTELNRKRIFRKIKASPKYESSKYALLSGLLECYEIPISSSDVSAVRKQLDVENKNRLVRLGYVPKGPFGRQTEMMEIGMAENLTEILFVANALGLSVADWSMAFENNSLSYFDGILSGISNNKNYYLKEDFITEIMHDIASTDDEIYPYSATYRAYVGVNAFGIRTDLGVATRSCPLLIKKTKDQHQAIPSSEVKFAEVPKAEVSELSPELSLVVNQCSSCHEGTRSIQLGRPIPFKNPKRLAIQLKSKSVSSDRTLYEEIQARLENTSIGKMPPTHTLAQNELTLLKSYLSGLIK